MKYLLRFECIADGAPYNRTFQWLGSMGPPRYYVRKLLLLDGKVYERPMHHMKDFTAANGSGTRGVYAEWLLEEGHCYTVKQPLSWTRFNDYYCTVTNGELVKLTREEVMRCLKSLSA